MQISGIIFSFGLISITTQAAVWDEVYMKRLKNSKLLNSAEIIENLKLEPDAKGCLDAFSNYPFLLKDPYYPSTSVEITPSLRQHLRDEWDYYYKVDGQLAFPAIGVVTDWYIHPNARDREVCGVKVEGSDSEKKVYRYRLKTFRNRFDLDPRYKISHQYHCGACSSLRDLYIYKSKPELTRPAGFCALLFPLFTQKECMKMIGFTDACAEAWAYNERSTRNRCMWKCLKSKFPESSALARSSYRGLKTPLSEGYEEEKKEKETDPCIACDEFVSGPGFKYTAGRTRRSSGLESSIERDPDTIYRHVNHDYFDDNKSE